MKNQARSTVEISFIHEDNQTLVKIDNLAIFPIRNMDNAFSEIENILLVNNIASNMVDMTQVKGNKDKYVIRYNKYFQSEYDDTVITIDEIAESYQMLDENYEVVIIKEWNDENYWINTNAHIPTLTSVYKDFVTSFDYEANNGNGMKYVDINNTKYYLTLKA